MARKLRMEEEGGLHHVINRGNYRKWIFASEGAKIGFEKALFECGDRFGWVLHAHCIMGNHFHLAVETPRGNVSEGMRWLQATFANRFNRLRKETGRLFQGRFKSLAVEDSQRLGWLCHYLHLNPVRAGICDLQGLRSYRWSSYWYLFQRQRRPKFLELSTCLEEAGGLSDRRAGWDRYARYLNWIVADEPTRKHMEFDRMSRGWAIGTRAFRKGLVQEERQLRSVVKRNQAEAREARELAWEALLEKALAVMKKGPKEVAAEPKAADWKVAVAALLKQRLACANAWLGVHLHMGVEYGVSRYVSEMQAGERPNALAIFTRLTARIK